MRSPARSAAAALLLAAAQPRAQVAVEVRAYPAPVGLATSEATVADVDGDGRADLVLVLADPDRAYHRLLHVHLATAPAGAEPAASLALPADVVAFAPADVDPDPGTEIVLVGARRAVAWHPLRRGATAFEPIAEGEFLWQVPAPDTLLLWDGGVGDLDGDDLVDLVLPGDAGYTVLLQRRDGDAVRWAAAPLQLPAGAAAAGSTREEPRAEPRQLEIGPPRGDGPQGPLLAVAERVPVPWIEDWDGDGARDLLAWGAARLFVWRQDPVGQFTAAPTAALDLPVVADAKRRLDVAYGAHLADLDRDHRADCVLVAGDYRARDVRSQVLVFHRAGGKPLFGAGGVPDQLLIVGGFTGGVDLADVDGDGVLDLVIGSLRVDALDALGQKVSERLRAELYVYRGAAGGFAKRPDLVHPILVSSEDLRDSGDRLSGRFVRDLTGDGTAELLLRSDPERLQLLLVRNRRGALTILPRPLWEIAIDAAAQLWIRELPGRPAAGTHVLVLEAKQVLHARFVDN